MSSSKEGSPHGDGAADLAASTTFGSTNPLSHTGVATSLLRIPPLGRSEAYYASRAKRAERDGDVHLRCAYKVAQYITLALDVNLEWDEKVKYFQHALDRHCEAPPYPDDETWVFYGKLADMVRENAGREALRLASQEDDLYAARIKMGQRRGVIEDEAEQYFSKFITGDQCPEYFNEEAYEQLKMLRNAWI
jgi:hypothetical protein